VRGHGHQPQLNKNEERLTAAVSNEKSLKTPVFIGV